MSKVQSQGSEGGAYRIVRERCVQYFDTPLEPQLHKPNRSRKPGRVMGESRVTRRVLLGAPPASAGPRHISRAYGRRAAKERMKDER
jgi:hypothetical protein